MGLVDSIRVMRLLESVLDFYETILCYFLEPLSILTTTQIARIGFGFFICLNYSDNNRAISKNLGLKTWGDIFFCSFLSGTSFLNLNQKF